MKYSSLGRKRWIWTHDDLGSNGYNTLGALECTLINLTLIGNVRDWDIDEMERFSYKFCGEKNFMPSPNSNGLIEVDESYIHLRKTISEMRVNK